MKKRGELPDSVINKIREYLARRYGQIPERAERAIWENDQKTLEALLEKQGLSVHYFWERKRKRR